jgi:hypothetical protein
MVLVRQLPVFATISVHYVVSGRDTAFSWYNKGLRTLDDVREGKGGVVLSMNQEIGLRFYNGAYSIASCWSTAHETRADINSRMPREEAGALYNLVRPIMFTIDPKLFVETMGSYGRYVGQTAPLGHMVG